MNPALAQLVRTPDAILGPFYPVSSLQPAEVDLTIDLSNADGEQIIIEGWVIDVKRAPIIGATVEIWHADAAGRYAHPLIKRCRIFEGRTQAARIRDPRSVL